LVAVKRILPSLADDPQFEARFIDEAKIAVSLSHSNIVSVLDFGRIGHSLILVMEHVDGPDLATLLAAQTSEPVPLAAALHIARELCHALGYAHSRNVLHRDV